MAKIQNIVFDFGKVLVDYDFKQFMLTIFDDPQKGEEFLKVTCNPVFVDKLDKGEKTVEDLFDVLVTQYPHWREQLLDFRDRQLDAITGEVPGMRDLIKELKSKGYGVYGLTNWSAQVYEVIRKYDILKMLDGTVISSEEKITKPDVRIFHILCERFNLKPEECLFVDDKMPNVEGAIKAGMRAVQFFNTEQFKAELLRRL